MKKNVLIIAIISICALTIILNFIFFLYQKENITIPQNKIREKEAEENKKEENGYLSITYTTSDNSVETGRIMNLYTYDLDSGELNNRAQIPFASQYALGVVSLSDNKVYYSYKGEGEGMKNTVDHLYEYNLLDGKSSLLETENCAYNDIIPINGKLLVTTVPVHAMGTAMFDLKSKTFSYLYEQSLNEDGYMDFPYTTRPVPLNYNYKYGSFVNVYAIEKDLYKLSVRTGKKSLKYYIDLVDSGLNIKNEYVFSLESFLDNEVVAAAQISSDCVILAESVQSDSDDTEYRFYEINFLEQSCKEIDSPFPNMRFINNFVTVDDGKSYYISGYNKKGDSGLFYYDCSNNDVKPILLDDYGENYEINNHVVNFCLVKN